MEETMLDFLNEVSKENGFDSWYHVYLIGNDEMHNIIPQKDGKRFANSKLDQAAELAGNCVHNGYQSGTTRNEVLSLKN